MVRRITGELAGLAEKAATEAEQLLVNARRALRRAQAKATELAASGFHDAAAGRRRGRLRRAVNDLTDLLEATRRIVAQTRQRLSGTTPDGATRRVSLHDGDARPIAKGRLGKPVEFGYKAQVIDNDDGVVLDHTVERGNPADAPQLGPRSAGSSAAPAAARAPSPPTAATAKPRSRASCTSSACAPWSSPAKADPAKPAKPTNTAARSAEQSSGAPAAKPESAPSNAATGGTAHTSMTWKGPRSGPDTGSWPTTWSRSQPSPHDRPLNGDQHAPPAAPDPPDPTRSAFFRSK